MLVENSQDGGVALQAMRSRLDALSENGFAIDIVDAGRNLGFAAGVNCALASLPEERTGPVLLLNSDARLVPGSLNLLRRALDDGFDVVAPQVVMPGDHVRVPVFYYHRYLALLTRRPLWGSFPFVTGACLLLAPRLARPGLFDESFFFYGEDVMLSARLAQEGRKFQVVPSSLVLHEGAGSAKNGSFFYEYHMTRGHWLLARKLCDGPLNQGLAVAARVVTLFTRAALRSIRTRQAVPLNAWRRATVDWLARSQTLPGPNGPVR